MTIYSSPWDTLKRMLFTKYLIKWKRIGRISWKFRYWLNLKSSIYRIRIDVILVQCTFKTLTIRRRSDYKIGFVTPAIGPNKFKKLTRLIAPVHNTRGKVWMKNNIHGFTDNKLIVCEALCAVFHSNFAA